MDKRESKYYMTNNYSTNNTRSSRNANLYREVESKYGDLDNLPIEDNTNEMIEFKLVNRNKMDVEYSNEYQIQMYKNREWKAFDEEYKFDVVKSSLTSGEVVIETINLKDTYGKLKKGRYRLIKRLGISEVAAEFKVK